MLSEHQYVTPEGSFESQVLHEDGQAPAHFGGRFQVHDVYEGQNVPGYRSADGHGVRERADISLHVSIDLQKFREGENITFHMPIHNGIVSEEKYVSVHGAIDTHAPAKQENITLTRF